MTLQYKTLPLDSVRKMRIKSFAFLLSLPLLALFCVEESMAQDRALEIETPTDYNFGTWSNSGSVSASTTTCAVSAQNVSRQDDWSSRNYKVKVKNLDTSAGFYLFLDGDSSNTGSRRIKIDMYHADLLDSGFYELLVENIYESQNQKGQAPGCPDGDNSSLRIDISAAELGGKVSGDYSGEFEIWIQESNSEVVSTGSFLVLITVGGAAKVKISNLDNIDLGQYSGTGAITKNETFCVYSESINGAYRISLSSTNQDSSANFYLMDDSTGEKIPLQIYFSDSGTGPGTTPMTANSVSALGNSADPYCAGIDNATVTMALSAQALEVARAGSYRSTLLLLVEPE